MFITFEGIDGSGKSSQVRILYEFLKENQIKVIKTTESSFSKTKWERKIIDIIINEEIDVKNKVLLMNSVRKEHLESVVFPKINDGYVVLCDRFLHSTIAYQGVFQNAGFDFVLNMHNVLCNNFMPDLIFFIDTDVKNAKNRMKDRGVLSKFDQVDESGTTKIRDGFLKCREMQNFVTINGNRSLKNVSNDIKEIVIKKIA